MKITKQSIELLHFLSNYKNSKYISQTNMTKKILSKLHSNMLNCYNYINNNITLNPNTQIILNTSQIIKPRYFTEKNFPEIIINHINKNSVSQIHYNFSLYNKKIDIYFVIEKQKFNIVTYNNYIKAIIIWLCILHNYSPKECVKSLSIYFYFTSLKKSLPNSKIEILNEVHVNTAFTTSCPNIGEIVIFRKEEWFKCFIHETFHTFGLDFSTMSNDNINKCISKIFNVNSKINAYEAYTEFWAEIINILFCSFYDLKNKNDLDSFYLICEQYMNYERIYGFIQMVKILDFMGLQYKDLFMKNKSAITARENLYKENTSVLSYYIIKTLLFNNYQDFINWCNNYNDNLLNFKKTIINQKLFCSFIEKNYKSKTMIDETLNVEIFYYGLKNNKKRINYGKKHINNDCILSNLRMTLYELG